MYCPNCGNQNSRDQKFCRSCGLGLEKIAQSLTDQLPTKADKTLTQQKEKLERLGVAAVSVFGLGVLSIFLYNIVYKMMLTQGKIMTGLVALALMLVLGCGLLSVILFAKANELKEAAAKRPIDGPPELKPTETTRALLPESHPEPIVSVTEGTTDLLVVEGTNQKRSTNQN